MNLELRARILSGCLPPWVYALEADKTETLEDSRLLTWYAPRRRILEFYWQGDVLALETDPDSPDKVNLCQIDLNAREWIERFAASGWPVV